jgi:hypothetical protein
MKPTTWVPTNRIFAACIAVLFGLGTVGCDDQPLAPSSADRVAETPSPSMEQAPTPFAVLSSNIPRERVKKGAPSGASASFGLIQGLDVAPNGDILVADLFGGIGSVGTGVDIPLFGVTDASSIGRSALWATVGPVSDDTGCVIGETTARDCGQSLYRASQGRTRVLTNLFDFEKRHNPDGLGIDSNPYDVQALDGLTALVVDAAGNDLLRVDNRGRVEVVAVFPSGDPVPVPFPPGQLAPEAVPTSIAIAPDGAYYVGELTGFPAAPGGSGIWKVTPDAPAIDCETGTGCKRVFDGGFTSIIDLAFGPDGALYVAELDESTWLAFVPGGPTPSGGTINKCDVNAGTCQEVASGIFFLTAITLDRDGTLWATTNFGAGVQRLP